jgi:dTDP-D-glucose 4,6-dehydratase
MTENNGEKNTNWLTSQDTMQMVWLLVGGGTLGSLYLIVKKNRNIFSWIIPVGMMAAGIDLLLKDRQERIKQTGDQIMSQLDELDPIARAEVVKYLAEQEKEKLSR